MNELRLVLEEMATITAELHVKWALTYHVSQVSKYLIKLSDQVRFSREN